MSNVIVLSEEAAEDIDKAVKYYDELSAGLGIEFISTLDIYFSKIAAVPTASAIRYDNVRVKFIDSFPFTIHFTIAPDNLIIILRVFNTHQQPFW